MKSSELIEALTAALERHQADTHGFMSMRELVMETGKGRNWVSHRLHRLLNNDRLLVAKQMREKPLEPGVYVSVPVYKIKPEHVDE